MAEQQNLNIVVSLVGDALPQLTKLRSEFQQISQMANGDDVTRMTREMEALNKQVKPVTEEANKASTALTAFSQGIGLAFGAVLAAGYGFYKVGEQIREFSQKLIQLNNTARATGFTAGQIKGVVDQMAQFGIGGAAALANIQSFASSLADLGRQGSELRQRLMQHSQSDPQAMEQFILRMLGARDRNDLVGAMNELLRAADAAFANAIKRGLPEIEAADIRKRFLAEFHLTPEMLAIIERLQAVGPEQEAAIKRQIELARQFTREWEKAQQAGRSVIEGIQTALMPLMVELGQYINANGEAWGKYIGTEIEKSVRDVRAVIGDLQAFWEFLKANPEDVERRLNENANKPTGWEWFKQWWRGGDAGIEPLRFMDMEQNNDEREALIDELKRLTDYLWLTVGGGAAGGGIAAGGGGLGLLSTQMGGLAAGLGAGLGTAGAGGAPNGSDVGPGTAAGAGDTPAGPGGTSGPAPAAGPAATTPSPAISTAGTGANRVAQSQAQVAGIRKLALQQELVSQLNYAAVMSGLRVDVTSGGQAAAGTGGPRTGSTRHDLGGAADFDLYDKETGHKLDMNNPADAARMAQFVEHAVRAGATGVGAGQDYMGASKIHVGGGKPATWGGADWIGPAWERGRANQISAEQRQRVLDEAAKPLVTQTPEQQPPSAMPEGYRAFLGGGPQHGWTDALGRRHTYPAGHPLNPEGKGAGIYVTDRKEFDKAANESADINASGSLTVNVKGPAGTKVTAEGDGAFGGKTEVNQETAPAMEE